MEPSQTSHAEELPHYDGEWFGPYRLIRPLGRGGFAPVYLAEEVHQGKKLRDVALKLFFLPKGVDPASTQAAEWREGVLSEARALCRVQHPSVVRFYSVHRDKRGESLGLAMEYVGGESLEGRLLRLGMLSDEEILDAATQVAWALSAVHAAGLVHRDVKPANIVCGSFGYKLIDFGVVADLDPSRLHETEQEVRRFVIGTPGYISPECLYRGAMPSPASDLYALGATIRKCFSGRLPSAESTLADAETIAAAEDAATLAAEIDPVTNEIRAPLAPKRSLEPHERDDVAALVEHLLAEDPHARPQHADWVARQLERMRAIGRAEPISVHSVDESVIPKWMRFPSEGEEAGPPLVRHPPLIGRDEALSTLLSAFERVEQGHVEVVLVSGPLGVGRTRLLHAAMDAIKARAGLSGARFLHAECRPERKSLLRPLVRAAEALSTAYPGALSSLREAFNAALVRDVLRQSREAGSELEVVETALSQAALDEPLCVVIDDLQWADAYTIELIRRLSALAAAEAGVKLFVLAALRHEPTPSPPLFALLSYLRARAHFAIHHVSLSPLAIDEAVCVAKNIAPLSPELCFAVARASGGVPFFLLNGISAWEAMGALVHSEGVYRPRDEAMLASDLPGAAELLQARFARAFKRRSGDGRLAARALAVIALHGGVLETEVLADVLAADICEPITKLIHAGLLMAMDEEGREVGFLEEMARQAALNVARARPWFVVVHKALLDAVAARPSPDAAFLASGYDKLGERALAHHWFGKAMQDALSAGLFLDAAELGDRLAAISETPRERAEIELAIVRALIEGRFFEDARVRLLRLETEAKTGRLSEDPATTLGRRILQLRVARGRRDAGMRDEALIADADAYGDPALRVEARLAVAGLERGTNALVIASEAIAIADGLSISLEFLARVLRFELGYEASPPQLSMAAADLERALQIAHETSSVWQQIHIEGDLAALEAALGNTGVAIERLSRLTQQAEALGMRGDRLRFLQNLAALLLRSGRAREAAETAAEVTRLGVEAGDPVLGSNAWSIRADALRRLGELDSALLSIDEAIRLQTQRGDQMLALSLLRRAEILSALHRKDDGRASAIQARSIATARKEHGLACAAELWLIGDYAQAGTVGRAEVEGALKNLLATADSHGAFVRSLIERTQAWLQSTGSQDASH